MTLEEKMKEFEKRFGDPSFAKNPPNFGLLFTQDQMKYLRWISCGNLDDPWDDSMEKWIHRLTNYKIHIGLHDNGDVYISTSHPDHLSDEQAYKMLDEARKYVVERHEIWKKLTEQLYEEIEDETV